MDAEISFTPWTCSVLLIDFSQIKKQPGYHTGQFVCLTNSPSAKYKTPVNASQGERHLTQFFCMKGKRYFYEVKAFNFQQQFYVSGGVNVFF